MKLLVLTLILALSGCAIFDPPLKTAEDKAAWCAKWPNDRLCK